MRTLIFSGDNIWPDGSAEIDVVAVAVDIDVATGGVVVVVDGVVHIVEDIMKVCWYDFESIPEIEIEIW